MTSIEDPEVLEPQLKYDGLGGDVREILGKERITCMTLSEKILALGTEQGRIHVLDYSGNQVRQLNVHKSRVNDISFDKEAEHVASASNDCSVVVTNLYTEQISRHEFKAPVKTAAIDPRPAAAASRRTWRDMVTGSGGGEVVLHTQGWLGRVDTPLAAASARDAAAGGVLSLRWSGVLVAWAFDSAVSVYDTQSSQMLRTLRRYDTPAGAAAPRPPTAAAGTSPVPPLSAAARSAAGGGGGGGGGIGALRRCSLLFAPDSHLYVAWSDVILVARIGTYENNVGWAAPQVELVARMRMSEAVLGVSPYGDDDLAVLVYPGGQVQLQPQPASQQPSQPSTSQPSQPSQPAAGSGSSEAGAGTGPAEGTSPDGGADKAGPPPPPPPPPDPLAPGRTPQLVILSRADHREWARDAVPLPGADRLSPSDYLGLLPSLPHQLHTAPAPAAAPAAGTPFGGRTGTAAAAAAAASSAPRGGGSGGGTTPPRRGSTNGGSGATSGNVTPRASVGSAAGAGSSGAAASPLPVGPRRLAPVWVDGQELMFFVAAPTAIATARSRDASDRVGWLLARRRWEEALAVVEGAAPGALPTGTYDRVIDGYIEELMTNQSYDLAVELSARLLAGDAKRWERFVYLFAQVRQLPKLVARIPTDRPRLRTQVYDMALQCLLPSPSDHPELLDLARCWPPGAYSMAALADAVAARLRRLQQQQTAAAAAEATATAAAAAAAATMAGGSPAKGGYSHPQGALAPLPGGPDSAGDPLWQLLAWLYEQQGRPDLALSIYLRLRSPGVFSFVTSHGLQANLLGRASDLFEVDERAALGLLTAHADALPPSNVVPSLQDAIRAAPSPPAAEVWRRRLYGYLAGLFAVDSSVAADYHDLQVSLTADYQPSKLMDLLVSSQYYSLEAAHAICESRGLVSEQVFVLGRMGNADQALRLIIDRLGDIPRAIDFVVGQRDEELWGRLVDWALGSPDTTGQLLDCIGGYVDPLLLVRRIPRGMRVERLRDRLRAIIADYRTQTSLREGCNAILRSDCRHLSARLGDGARRALPAAFVQRPGTGGEPGQWYRCDIIHGGRLQPVSAAEVPWEAADVGLLAGPGGGGPSPPSASPPAGAAGAAANPLGSGAARNSGNNLTGVAGVQVGAAGGGGGASRLHHGASVPLLDVGLQSGGGSRRRGGGVGASASSSALATEGLPWWALSEGAAEAAVASSGGGIGGGGRGPAAAAGAPGATSGGLWVGFNLAAGRARMGGEDGLGIGPHPYAGTQAAGRRAGPGGPRPGHGTGLGGGGGGAGSGAGGGVALGSLWQHVAGRA